MNRHLRRSVVLAAILSAGAIAVSGCTNSNELPKTDPTQKVGEVLSDTESTADADAGLAYVPPLIEDLPACEEVFGILGDLTVDLVPERSENNGSWGDSVKYGLSCAWLTNEAVSENVGERIKASGVGAQIIIEEDPLVETDYVELGMIVDDPRMAEIGGLLVVPGGELDLSEDLGMVGPAVVVDRVHITLVVVGAFLSRNDSADNLTNDQAIDGAIALHKALAQ